MFRIDPGNRIVCDCGPSPDGHEHPHFKIAGVLTAWKNHVDGRLMVYGERHPKRPLSQQEALALSEWIRSMFMDSEQGGTHGRAS